MAAILHPSTAFTNWQVPLPRFSGFPSMRNTKSKYTDRSDYAVTVDLNIGELREIKS
jgi:hypothetical protein